MCLAVRPRPTSRQVTGGGPPPQNPRLPGQPRVSRTTYYRWARRAEAHGPAALMPKGRRPPAMPNQTPVWVVDELLAEAVVRPTLGARRYAEQLRARGLQISASGVQKILVRHGLGRRRQRVAALAQVTAATSGLVTDNAKHGPSG